jgi:hypothetical protein
MARTISEVVSITRDELIRLKRDGEILDWLEASAHALAPERPSHRKAIGDLIDAGRSLDEVLDQHARRLEARESRPDRPTAAPRRSHAG